MAKNMNSFLQQVAKYLHKTYGSDIHKLNIVFPNKRARLYFNETLSWLINKPIISPRYYTINEYLSQITKTQSCDPLQLQFLLYEAYKQLVPMPASIDQFLPYSETIISDFDDIDKSNVEAKQLYQNLVDLKNFEDHLEYLSEAQIEALQKFWKTFHTKPNSNEKDAFIRFWDVMYGLYEKFNTLLETKHLAYDGSLYKKALKRIENSDGNSRSIVFIGFNALNEVERKIFRKLKQQGKALFFWDYSDYYMQPEIKEYHSAAYFLKSLAPEFKMPEDFQSDSNIENFPEVEIIEVASDIGQASLLPHFLENIDKKEISNNKEILIGLADEEMLPAVLKNIPDSYPSINISMGYPLANSNAFNLLQSILLLYKNHKRGKGDNTYYHKHVFSILKNGLLQSVTGQEPANILIQKLTSDNRSYITSARFNEHSEILQKIFSSEIAAKELTSHITQIFNTLFSFTSKEDNPLEYECLFKIITQLTCFADIVTKHHVDAEITTLCGLILRYMQGISVPFSGEPLEGIQIMGVLETRTLDFSHIIILSMNEGAFPKTGSIPTFIPYTLRKGFGLPTLEHRDAIFAYYFYRLLHRAKKITLCYSTKDDGLYKGEASRFIHQLKINPKFKVHKKTIEYKVEPGEGASIEIPHSENISNTLKKYTQKDGAMLSPSAINTYINCSLRFYYRYIAHLNEPDDIQENIEANVFGTILHDTIDMLYAPFAGSSISPADIKGIQKNSKLVNTSLDKAFQKQKINTTEATGTILIARKAAFEFLHLILNYDFKQAPFNIVSLEKKYTQALQINEHGLKINIGGYIDRLDEKDGYLRVIDYKTGRDKGTKSNLEALFNAKPSERDNALFQILIYSEVLKLAGKQHIQPGLFYVRNMNNSDYTHIKSLKEGKNDIKIEDYEVIANEFTEMLCDALLNLFERKTGFIQTNDLTYCKTCAYNKICNRNE